MLLNRSFYFTFLKACFSLLNRFRDRFLGVASPFSSSLRGLRGRLRGRFRGRLVVVASSFSPLHGRQPSPQLGDSLFLFRSMFLNFEIEEFFIFSAVARF